MHVAVPTDRYRDDICVYEIPDEILGPVSEDPQESSAYMPLKERKKELPTVYQSLQSANGSTYPNQAIWRRTDCRICWKCDCMSFKTKFNYFLCHIWCEICILFWNYVWEKLFSHLSLNKCLLINSWRKQETLLRKHYYCYQLCFPVWLPQETLLQKQNMPAMPPRKQKCFRTLSKFRNFFVAKTMFSNVSNTRDSHLFLLKVSCLHLAFGHEHVISKNV